jgi:prepilin-type N-terminal cleavage/methylation domain-containing protein
MFITKPHGYAGQRGFTLTEIAVVLLVISSIIGGIFAVISSIHYRQKINQGSEAIGTIVTNMRALYAGQNLGALTVQNFSSALEQQFSNPNTAVFPADMACVIGGATYSCNPWDRTTVNGSAQISIVAGTPRQFILRYAGITAEVCADLLVRNSAPGADTGLQQIVVGATNYSGAQLPVTPANAASACPVGATYTIDWYFKLAI